MRIKRFNESIVTEIPTVEEFISDNIDRTAFPNIDNELEDNTQLAQTLKDIMIEFAKLHVEEALQAVSENIQLKTDQEYTGSMGDENGKLYKDIQVIDMDSIFNAYSLENIK